MRFTQGSTGLLRAAWTMAGLAALATVFGCGPGGGTPASLSGQVTYDGEPVAEGNIRLMPLGETGGAGGASKITGGSYQIPADEGMVAGEYRVVITANRSTGKMVPGADGEGEVEETVPYIPHKYGRDSELTLTVSAGENSHDFTLERGDPPTAEEE